MVTGLHGIEDDGGIAQSLRSMIDGNGTERRELEKNGLERF